MNTEITASTSFPATAFFDVARTPAYADFNGERVMVGQDALINQETGNVIGIVGRNYKVTKNEEVDNIFSEAFDGFPVESIKDHLSGTTSRWQRDIILTGDRFTHMIGGTGRDAVKTKVSIWNGYDGKSSVGFAISGFRQVCSNGLMGWRSLFGAHLRHVSPDAVGRIRREFENNLHRFERIVAVWNNMTEVPFTKQNFIDFVNSRVRQEDNDESTGFLSERQAKSIIDMYDPIMSRYNEDETRWAGYNVLTEIATHRTKARQGSNIFGNGYRVMEKLTTEFFSEDLFRV